MYYEPSALISAHWRFILIVGIVAGLLVGGLSFFQTLEYRATSRLLITPFVSNTGEVFDQFTALKSAEQMGNTLSQLSETTLFQNRVIKVPYDIRADLFENDARKRRKQWSKTVQVDVVPGSGVLVVSIFDESKNRAVALSRAVSDVLVSSGHEYLPGQVEIRLVDPPLLSKYPVRPNIPFRALAGLLFGMLLAVVYVFITPHNRRHDEFRLM
ncbi:MAG: hypothetical protein CMI52_00105 [Parcubacteria group bacterium]|nr:hypothetical protein [Parcubacteria group bacterium]